MVPLLLLNGTLPGSQPCPRQQHGLVQLPFEFRLREHVRPIGGHPNRRELLVERPVIENDAWAKAITNNEAAGGVLTAAIATYGELAGEWRAEPLHAATLALAEQAGLKLGKAQAPIRAAVTGRTVGPPLFESLELLGPDVVLGRLRSALDSLGH